jgi:cytoplasmic FMR1 interacting protein
VFNALYPEVQKLIRFQKFAEEAVDCVSKNITSLIASEKRKVPEIEILYDHLVKLIDMVVLLDQLKDMKSCFKNDMSRCNRAFSSIKGEFKEDEKSISDAFMDLQLKFLSSASHPNGLILSKIREELQKQGDVDLVLIALIEHCSRTLQEDYMGIKGARRYLLPDEGNSFYRVLPFLIRLLDGNKKDPKSLNAFKQDCVLNLRKMFRHRPVVHLYGDMHITMRLILDKADHWTPDLLDDYTSNDNKEHQQYYLLKHHQSLIRSQYNTYLVELTAVMNEIKAFQTSKVVITPELHKKVFDTVLKGFRHLSSWSSKIREQSAWKFAHPVTEDEFKKAVAEGKVPKVGSGQGGQEGKGGNYANYAKVVQLNYSQEDLGVLIDVISMIKGLGGLLLKGELLLVPILRRHIHDVFQLFLQQEVARPLRKAHKRGREKVKLTMLNMRDIACDWINREQQKDDYHQKRDDLVKVNRDFPRRATAPTSTQITLIRSMMHSIFSPRAEGMKGGFFGGDKDLKSEWIPVWESFYQESFFLTYLLEFGSTVRTITDMSFLWFREFFLEMSKCVQFPISMSLPWIMTEFLISRDSMKENMFFPVDIYNDSGAHALRTLRQQFLYDEVEAELNLSFDQLTFHMSKDIFRSYKTRAAAILIDKEFRKAIEAIKKKPMVDVSSRYGAVMAQRQLTILGRNVDLNMIIAKNLNTYLRDNVQWAIRKFESGDLTNVYTLQLMLENVQLAHALMAEHLPIDSYETIFSEANRSTDRTSFSSNRVLSHVVSELLGDILPNYVYNSATQRFVKPGLVFVDAVDRASAGHAESFFNYGGRGFQVAFERKADLLVGFFGQEHLDAILRVLSPVEVPLLIDRVISDAVDKILYEFKPYADIVINAMPPMKLPKLQYGVIGCYGFFDLKLKNNLASYPGMRSGVFQLMRNIGNSLALLQQLDAAQERDDILSFTARSFFQHVRPRPGAAAGADAREAKYFSSVMVPEGSQFASVVAASMEAYAKEKNSDQALADQCAKSAQAAAAAYAFQVARPSLLATALGRISAVIDKFFKEEWKGSVVESGLCPDMESPRDLVRMLSCLRFLYCQTPECNPCNKLLPEAQIVDDVQIFGDGWHWSFCMFLHVLNVRSRFEYQDFCNYIVKVWIGGRFFSFDFVFLIILFYLILF